MRFRYSQPFRFVALLVVVVACTVAGSVGLGAGDDADIVTMPPSKVADDSVVLDRRIHMVVVFTRFADEWFPNDAPPAWADRMFDGAPGSLPYYFDEVSYGTVAVTGEYIPLSITLSNAKVDYAGKSRQYCDEVLSQLINHPDVDFSRFDTDGPDGVPGSGDDDGYVDCLVLMPWSCPYDFIVKGATGVALLPMNSDKRGTGDRGADGQIIQISASSGMIATANTLDCAVGLVAHEYIHTLGMRDLYDKSYTDEDNDSAGIGYWGVMGRGIMGWNDSGGPVGPCAYTRVVLGWAGKNNSALYDVYGSMRNLKVTDIASWQGGIYRIWVDATEYFLVEYRSNTTLYCDRNLPGSGLLIWHVNITGSNSGGHIKLCDLECADGRYADAGYPLGRRPDPINGGDNLDFWSHNAEYNAVKAGNLGDATDMFDGVVYREFSAVTNPDSRTMSGKDSKVSVTNIRPLPEGMLIDVTALTPAIKMNSSIFDFNLGDMMIGMGYQRFVSFKHEELAMPQKTAMFLVGTADGGLPDDYLVSVHRDSITTVTVSDLDESILQSLILSMSGADPAAGIIIARHSIDSAVFDAYLMALGIDARAFFDGDLPVSIQEIECTRNEKSPPRLIEVSQNHPNPFNARTMIEYQTMQPGQVTVEVFSILGQRVALMDRGIQAAGSHTVVIDAEDFSTGVYFYRVTCGEASMTRKFLIMR